MTDTINKQPTPLPQDEAPKKAEPVVAEDKKEEVEIIPQAVPAEDIKPIPKETKVSSDAGALTDKPTGQAPSPTPVKPQALPTSTEVEVDGGQTKQSSQPANLPIEVQAPIKPPADLPTGQAGADAVADKPSNPVIPFMTQFLDKLKELRGQANTVRHENMEENLKKVMEFAKEKGKVMNDDVERLTGVSDRQALNYLKILLKRGDLMKFGAKKNTFYKPVKK